MGPLQHGNRQASLPLPVLQNLRESHHTVSEISTDHHSTVTCAAMQIRDLLSSFDKKSFNILDRSITLCCVLLPLSKKKSKIRFDTF